MLDSGYEITDENLNIKEQIQNTKKHIHEVLYRLSRVVDNGTSFPLLENNTPQVFAVF
jgi:hypothetical protein